MSDSVSKKESSTGSVSDFVVEKERKKESKYTYIHIHIHHKTKTFYITPGRIETYQKLEEILKREAKSFSDWIFPYAEEYVRLHEPGNPQQRIDVIAELGKPYRANACFECGAKPKFKMIYSEKEVVLLCGECFDKLKKRAIGWIKL